MNSFLDKGVVTLNSIPNFKPQGMMYGGEPSKVLSEPPPLSMQFGGPVPSFKENNLSTNSEIPNIVQSVNTGVMTLPLNVQRPITFGGITSLAGGGQPGYGLMGLMMNTYKGMI
tara:strand:- start:41 stop:382 length:342 start_codon:yes stop_codon:yes gene_type:complete